ncbi:MAG: SLATT domain-containing protein [Roseivirga sp.]|nr:SLATT domain-containing protein [Roseivirga sp.]
MWKYLKRTPKNNYRSVNQPKDDVYMALEEYIDKIRRKKRRYGRSYKAAKILVFLAGGLITVFTGWKHQDGDIRAYSNVILVISATIALITALEGLFSLRVKAESYDLLLFRLRRLRERMYNQYQKDAEVYAELLPACFKEYQEILEEQKAIIAASYGDED